MSKKEKGKLYNTLPQCASEFINLVIKKMRYHSKVQQDVQAELAAHFEDELKDCATNEEKEQKAQQLITEFGDMKLLAVLLRRAKKRCRPLWRTIVARTFQAVGMIVLCFILYVVWFLSGKPNITTNYVAELNRMVRPVADETLNAAPLYDKAIELYGKIPDDVSILFGTQYIEANAEEKQHIAEWITNNEEIFNIVIAGTKKPYYWSNYCESDGIEDMMGICMPKLAGFRKLVFALRWRVWLRAEQGRFQDAFNDVKACYRLGQHLRGDKTLIEQLVGIAVEALAVQTIRDIISQYEISSATLSELQKDFEQMIADEDFVVSFKVEKFLAYDVIQRTFTGGLGGGHIIPKRVLQLYPEVQIIGSASARDSRPSAGKTQKQDWMSRLILNIRYEICEPSGFIYEAASFAKKGGYILFLHPGKQQTLQAVEGLYDYWEALRVKTPAQIRADGIDVEKETMAIVKGNILLEESAPAVGRVFAVGYANKVSVEAMLTIIAILRYKQDIGRYPEDLNELIAKGYLKQLPVDPYSDKPLVYKKTDNDFVLYGFGLNFKDDGGKIFYTDKGRPIWRGTEEGGDMLFWPVLEAE